MEVLRTLERLFEDHAPETLMAFFGAATSILLFYLIWAVLRHFFGLQTRSVVQEADQEQATTALVKSLVGALLSEAEHLRQSLDDILQESLKRGERNAEALAVLLARTEKTPEAVLHLLKPEFGHLHQAIQQAEAQIVLKLVEVAGHSPEKAEQEERAYAEQAPEGQLHDLVDVRSGEHK